MEYGFKIVVVVLLPIDINIQPEFLLDLLIVIIIFFLLIYFVFLIIF